MVVTTNPDLMKGVSAQLKKLSQVHAVYCTGKEVVQMPRGAKKLYKYFLKPDQAETLTDKDRRAIAKQAEIAEEASAQNFWGSEDEIGDAGARNEFTQALGQALAKVNEAMSAYPKANLMIQSYIINQFELSPEMIVQPEADDTSDATSLQMVEPDAGWGDWGAPPSPPRIQDNRYRRSSTRSSW